VPPLAAAVAATAASIAGTIGISVATLTSIVSVAASIGLSFVAKALTPGQRNTPSATAGSTTVTVRDPLAPRRIVYGRTRVPGTVVYLQTISDNNQLGLVIAFCDGLIEDIEQVFFNDELLPIDWGTGNVTGGPYINSASLFKFLGDPNQAASGNLISFSGGQWTSAHRLRGIAYLFVNLNWSTEVYSSGLPNITAILRGRKVYDPRSATTVYSDNPAICLRDFLLLPASKGGVGAVASEIDEASFIAAANVCDEPIPRTGEQAEPRYTVSGYIELNEGSTPQALVQSLLTACAGTLTFVGGKWRLLAGAWRSPTFTVTDSILRGPLKVETRISRRDQFNAVKGAFRSPSDRYVARDYPAVTSSTFQTQDGGTLIYRDLPLDWTSSPTMAQRLAKIELYRSRLPITVQAQCNLSAYAVTVGDVVNVTHDRWGWTNKTFEVIDVRWAVGDDMAPGIDLVMRETNAAVYDWTAGEGQLLTASPSTSFPNWTTVAAPIFNLTAGDAELFISGDGSVQSRIKVSITPVANAFVDRWEIRWKLSADATFTDPISVGAAGSNVWWISPIYDGQAYDVEVRAVTVIGGRSAWSGVYGFVPVGKLAPPPDIASVSISEGLLRWEYPNPPADLAGFKVRYHAGSFVFWGSGVEAHSGLLSAGSLDVAALLTGPVTLMVKAVDTSGNESVNAAVVLTDLGDPIVENVIVDYDLRALGFPGTITSGTISGGDLVGVSGALFWGSNSAPFYPPGQVLFWPTDIYGDVVYSWSYAPDATILDATMSIFTTVAGSPWSITYRENGGGLFWTKTDAAAFWGASDAAVFWTPAGDFLSWPGSLSPIRRTLYEFRLSVTGGAVQPDVSELRLVFDVPDVIETLGDVAVLAAGTRLPLTRTFRVITAVNLTVQAGANAAVTARIEDKLLTGPLVTARNAAGTAVDASLDAIVQGY
jgi:hypothetical protein